MAEWRADYHMHTTVSDGHCSMKRMCERAIELGLEEIALTDHFEIYTPGFDAAAHGCHVFDEKRLDHYFSEYQSCKRLFEGKIRLKRGIELGQPQVDSEYSQKIMSSYEFDYVIGSVHKLNNIDLAFADYPNIDLERITKQNLEMLFEMTDQYDFDCIGHIDLIKRYAAVKGVTVHLRDYPEQLGSILSRAIERGKGLEINTSGMRQAAREALPSLQILKYYRKLGGEILTVGSDAHIDIDLGKGIQEAKQLALEAGFRYLALYTNRKPEFYPIS